MDIVGQICAGNQEDVLVRQKTGSSIELGELLIAEQGDGKILMRVYSLEYGSQMKDKSRELIAGMELEGHGSGTQFLEPGMRNYIIARCKPVSRLSSNNSFSPKSLPPFMGKVRRITEQDLAFLARPENPLFLGKVRSGSRTLEHDIYFNGREALSHHILIPASTGKGKSNLVKVILWNSIERDYCGFLVLDPHDEYFGRSGKGLKDHPRAHEKVKYYTLKPCPGACTLKISMSDLRPWHFDGVMKLSDAQRQAMSVAFNVHGEDWIAALARNESLESRGVNPLTQTVLMRILESRLGITADKEGNAASRSGIFSQTAGKATVRGIVSELEKGSTVIIDTSTMSGETELLVGSMIAHEVLSDYRKFRIRGEKCMPVISIVLEEAPRVLGSDALSEGGNIYSSIAREGRKFGVGLMAITQLSSIIPRPILANMNTKLILGNEMEQERNAVISSASQDLSRDSQNIAALDKGEAIITSSFTRFALPVKIPLFEEFAEGGASGNSHKVNVIG